MSAREPIGGMPLDRRRARVLAVVGAQDGGTDVGESRAEVARQLGVTEDGVKTGEWEGPANQWRRSRRPRENPGNRVAPARLGA